MTTTALATTPDGSRLPWQSFGRTDDPTLVLLGGAGWSMDWWEDGLCEALAARGRRVVRLDQRDTGGATHWPAGAPAYGPDDLADDVVTVLDAARVPVAHLIGLSMGGGLAQRLAAHHRDRVASLTLVATSPAVPDVPGLAPPTPALMAAFAAEPPEPDWTDRDAVVDHVVAGERPLAGPDAWDEARLRALVGRVVDRSPDMAASLANHLVAAERDAAPVRLADLAGVPALVVHGDADPLFPGHGRVLADLLGAAYVELPGVGHQLPPPHLWPTVVDAVVAHTGGA